MNYRAQRSDQAIPLVVDARGAAKLCGISRAGWFKMRAAGRVPDPLKLGRARRWSIAEIRRWMRAGCPNRDLWNAMKARKP